MVFVIQVGQVSSLMFSVRQIGQTRSLVVDVRHAVLIEVRRSVFAKWVRQ